MRTYYVGPARIMTETIEEARQLAVEMMPGKPEGESVAIYTGKYRKGDYALVKVLLEKKSSKLRYVYFTKEAEFGHTITKDYGLDLFSRWCKGAYHVEQ